MAVRTLRIWSARDVRLSFFPRNRCRAKSTNAGSNLARVESLRKEMTTGPDLAHFMAAAPKPRSDFEASKWCHPITYAETMLPVNEATSLDPQGYYDPEFFKIEQERIFGKAWVIVGYSSQLNRHGDTITGQVGGASVFVTVTKKGDVKGFYNVCRHRGHKLVQKNGRYSVISCPYHRWGYSLDGKLLGTPLFKPEDNISEELQAAFNTSQAKSFHKKDYGLFPVRVEKWGPFVFANLSADAPPLNEYLGDLPTTFGKYPLDELVIWREQNYSVNANYKLLMENFMEYYHLPAIHPNLCNVSVVENHRRAQGPGCNTNFVTHPLGDGGTPIDKTVLPMMGPIGELNAQTAWFPTFFPNCFTFLLPHSMFNVHVNPKTPERSEERAVLLVHPSALELPEVEEKLEAMWDFYTETNDEDIAACESVQEAIANTPYSGGRYAFRFEEPIHRYQNMVVSHMIGQPTIPKGDAIYGEEALVQNKTCGELKQ